MLGDDADSGLSQRLPTVTEAPSRERLRWEKELLGLYLSDHPLGELSAEMDGYVDTRTGDIGADLDQERVVVGGMAVGIRRVITRNRESMAVVTLEDMQGAVDVVVFPRTYADAGTAAKLNEDAVLLVAGRVDHKGDETVVLADTVWTWDEVTEQGRDAFAQAVAAGDRGRRGGRRRNGNGRGRGAGGNGDRPPGPGAGSPAPAVTETPAAAAPETLVVPRVSPLRGGRPEGTITVTIGGPAPPRPVAPPAATGSAVGETAPPLELPPQEVMEPVSGLGQPPAFEGLGPAGSDEPPLPDEASVAVASAARAPTLPVEAGPGQVLHVRFAAASDDRLVAVFEELKGVIKARPGGTPIVLHIPAGAGRTQEMRLGAGVAYDTELLAEAGRRFEGLLQLTLV
jgi:hypothetical protein